MLLVATSTRMTGANLGLFDVAPGGTNLADSAIVYADAVDNIAVKDYMGGTAASQDDAGNATTITVLCESDQPRGQGGTANSFSIHSWGYPTRLNLYCSCGDTVACFQ